MHEWLIGPVRRTLDVSGIFHFAWVIPAICVLAIGLLIYIPFLRYLAPALRNLFIIAGLLYLSGAIGLEMLGGAAASGTLDRFIYQFSMPFEELLEMLGLVAFAHGLTAVIRVA